MSQVLLDARPLSELAHAAVRDLILGGDLPLGSPIAEEALAERLGISRTPLREALRRLTADGLIVAGERQRARVATVDAAEATGIQEVRAVLDALAAVACARRHGAVDLAGLRRMAAAVEERLHQGELGAAFAADGDFHLALARESGNRELLAHLGRIDGRVHLVRLARCPRDPAAILPQVALHGRLLEAIAAGDAVAAERIARAHALDGLP